MALSIGGSHLLPRSKILTYALSTSDHSGQSRTGGNACLGCGVLPRPAIRLHPGRCAANSDERNHNFVEELGDAVCVGHYFHAGLGCCGGALPPHLHVVVYVELQVVWNGAAMVASYIAAAAPSRGLSHV